MDKDVEARFNRLCRRYGNVAAAAAMLVPHRLPTTKQARRLDFAMAELFAELREARSIDAGSLIKLAYVRALREVVPKARLEEDQLAEVAAFEGQLVAALERVEDNAMAQFRSYTRSLRVAQRLEELKTPAPIVSTIRDKRAAPYPLEQRARASVRSIVEIASAAGALAGTSSGSYDIVRNGT